VAKKKKHAEQDESTGQGAKPLILLFLLLSGSCGLVYEILWMKMLTLTMGNTVFSITTVLTAFMGGLALGSFLAGRFTDKIKNPLRAYGLLEGGIGVYALLLPLLIAGTQPLFRFVYQSINPSFYTFGLLRFVVCGTLLLVPTALMGATLPVLSQYFVAGQNNLGRNVGLLYGMNTLGAVLGCSLAGFLLIPALGVTWTIYGAALLNLAICAGVLKLADIPVQRKQSSGDKEITKGKKQKKQQKRQQRQNQEMQKKSFQEAVPEIRPAVVWVVMAGIGVSGLAAMVYQIAWTRVLSLSIGSSVYAFSLIVTAFICGLALGSLVITPFIDRRRDRVLMLALLQGVIGLSALGILHVLGNLPVYAARFLFDAPRSFQYIQLLEFAVVFGLVLVPTFMMGATVPVAVKICTPDARQVGKFFGNVYAINTLGAIIGSFAAGFILIPWLGARNSILTAVAMNILMAVILFLRAPTPALPRRVIGSVVTVAMAVLVWYPLAAWDASVLTSGPYLYTDRYQDVASAKKIDLRAAMQAGRELIYFKEGLHAAVAVEKTSDKDLVLLLNGKADASAKGDAATQLMLGHLPLLLHQSAENVLVIGLGIGMTLGAVERYPVKGVDVVEIEPAVVEASSYFKDFTADALNDPRVNLIVGDGRNYLALTNRQYDVVISEPSNPWVSGMANLFTREFFESAKNRLAKDGVMCQWVHAYSMSSVDFKTIVATFRAVFPRVAVWEASFGGDYLLIGARQELKVDYPGLLDRLGDEGIRADLVKMRIQSPATFLDKLVMTDKAVVEYARDAPLHTDDNARLEYSAPKALVQARSTLLLKNLYRFRPGPAGLLSVLKGIENSAQLEKDLSYLVQAKKLILDGFIHYANGAARDAIKKFEEALAISPKNYDAAELLAKLNFEIAGQYKNSRRPDEAAAAYEKSIEAIDNFMAGEPDRLSDYFALEVIYARANLILGVMALNANRLKQAAAALEKSVAGQVRFAEAHNNLGVAYARLGKYDAAARHYHYAIELNPLLVSARMNYGNLLLRQKKYPEAIASFHRVQELKPDFAITNYNLGMAYFMQNQWEQAEAQWMRALELKPDFAQAQQGLAVVRQKMGSQ